MIKSVPWDYYDKFDDITAIGMYMPRRGEGDTKASQIVTAVNKLIYKLYNDGDVFDNTYAIKGWCNDLSSYANWLYQNCGWAVKGILRSIEDCKNYDDYALLIKALADELLKKDFLEEMNKIEKTGTIYKCDGPFRFVVWDEEDEDEEDDDEDWYDDEEDEE